METEKKNIIEKISDRFLSQGAKSVTMDEVSAICGISKKTLYQVFPTKEILLADMLDYVFNKIVGEIRRIQSENNNPIEELVKIHQRIHELILSNEDVFMYQLCKFYPEIHQNHCQNNNSVMLSLIENNIQRGIQQEMYRENIEVSLIARFFFSLNMVIKHDELFNEYRTNSKKLYYEMIAYHLHSLFTDKGREYYESLINTK